MTDSDLRELDGWIADKLFKGDRVAICFADDHSMDDFTWCYDCRKLADEAEQVARRYTTKPSAFALVKREIERRGWGWVSMRLPDVADTPYHFRIITVTKELGFGEAATEELAGCRAISRTEGL